METEKSIEPTNTAEENDLTKRIEAILADLKKHLADKTDSATNPEQQELVGRLINLLPYLEHLKNSRINVGQAEAAAAALNSTPQHLELAKTIIVQLEKRKDIYRSVFLSVWEGRSVAAQLLLGVACHVILLIFIVMSFPKMHESLGDIEPMLIWVFVGGALGGITSLLVRLHDFAVMARWAPETDPKILFFTGLLKPVIGILFALFVWSAFSSGLLSLNLPTAVQNTSHFYFALSFIAGFSERFASDLANRAPSMPSKSNS